MSRISTCRACSFYGAGGKSRIAIPHTCGKSYEELSERKKDPWQTRAENSAQEQKTYLAYCQKKGIEPQVEFLSDNIVAVPCAGFFESETAATVLFRKIPMYYKNSRLTAKVDFTFSDGLCTFIFSSCR